MASSTTVYAQAEVMVPPHARAALPRLRSPRAITATEYVDDFRDNGSMYMVSATTDANANTSSRWLILCHMWAGVCLYNAANVGLQRHGLRIGVIPALFFVMTGYYGSRLLFSVINKGLISQKLKIAWKILITLSYFPAAIILAMLIGQSNYY